MKRKDQMNALKNLIELNDINQQYKIIDIMLKGLFKVSHSAGWPPSSMCHGVGVWAGEAGRARRSLWGQREELAWQVDFRTCGEDTVGLQSGVAVAAAPKDQQDGEVTKGSGRCWRTPGLCSLLLTCLPMGLSLRMRR